MRQGEKEKRTNDDIRQGKINWTEKNTRNGEPPGPKKVHRKIHGRDVGVRFRMGTRGRGSKWYVCVMGTGGGTAKIKKTGKVNRAGVGIEKMKRDYYGTRKY